MAEGGCGAPAGVALHEAGEAEALQREALRAQDGLVVVPDLAAGAEVDDFDHARPRQVPP